MLIAIFTQWRIRPAIAVTGMLAFALACVAAPGWIGLFYCLAARSIGRCTRDVPQN
jgi:hypothetical protein